MSEKLRMATATLREPWRVDADDPAVSPDPATLDAPGCLAEVHRLYRVLQALPSAEQQDGCGHRAPSPRYLALQAQIYALSRRHSALTATALEVTAPHPEHRTGPRRFFVTRRV